MVLSAFCEGRDFLPRQRVVPGNYHHTTQNYYTDSITCMIYRSQCPNARINSHEEMLLTRLASGALSAKQGRLLEMEVFFFKSHLTLQKCMANSLLCGLGNIRSLMLLKRLRWIRVQLLMFTNGSVKCVPPNYFRHLIPEGTTSS